MRRLPILFLMSSTIAAGCSAGSIDGENDPGGGEVAIATDLRLMENNPNCEDVEVLADSLRFHWKGDTTLVDIPVGSVVVGERGGGYVRRIMAVEKNGKTIDVVTEQASLADAVLEGDIAANLVPEGGWSQVNCPAGASCVGFDLIDLSNTVLFDGDVGGVPLRVFIPSGGLHFSPSVDFDMSIGFPGKIKRLSGSVTGAFTADIEVVAETSGAVDFAQEIDVNGPTPLLSYPFTFVAPTPFGPLPIVGTANMDVFVGFNAHAGAQAQLATGLSATAAIEVGATFEDGEWTASAEPTFDALFDPIQLDASADVSLEAYARPEISVTFYGVAGPRLSVEPSLRFNGGFVPPDSLQGQLDACMRGELGFSVKILSFELADFSRSLERCITLFQGGN